MDALIEVHTAEEIARAREAGARIVGVNNRDLRTFEVRLETSIELAAHAPTGSVLVSESGIRDAEDIGRLRACGYGAFLVGETLMRAVARCRSEEHTSELQSQSNLVCRLLLEKK